MFPRRRLAPSTRAVAFIEAAMRSWNCSSESLLLLFVRRAARAINGGVRSALRSILASLRLWPVEREERGYRALRSPRQERVLAPRAAEIRRTAGAFRAPDSSFVPSLFA